MDSVFCCHPQTINNVWLLKQLELWYNLLFVAHEQTYRLLVRRDSVESTIGFTKMIYIFFYVNWDIFFWRFCKNNPMFRSWKEILWSVVTCFLWRTYFFCYFLNSDALIAWPHVAYFVYHALWEMRWWIRILEVGITFAFSCWPKWL